MAPRRLALTLLWVLLNAGCQREPPADLVIINGPEPETLDPHLLSGIAEQRLAPALFEGLLRRNPTNGLAMPGLAEGFSVSTDGRQYRFRLRPQLTWSTGEPLTAEDVVYSWRRLVTPATGARYANVLSCVEGAEALLLGTRTNLAELGIKAVDERTVTVRLTRATPYFPELCALPALAVVPRRTIEAFGDRWILARPLPSSGPYGLDRWRLNDRVRLRRNTHYWDAANVRSTCVDLLPSENAVVTLNLFETGGADVVWDRHLFPAELASHLREPKYHAYPFLATYFVRMNTTRAPLTDPRVRRAIAQAIDVQRLVTRITGGLELPARSFTPPGCGGYEPPALAVQDLGTARRGLAEAGYPEGRGLRPLEYLVNSGGGGGGRLHEQIAIELQAQLREHLGLRLEIRPVETKVYYSEQSQLNYDLCRSSWIGDYPDPTTFLDIFRSGDGNNRTGWANPEYDRALAEAATLSNPRERFVRLQAAEARLLTEGPPLVPLYFYSGFCAFDPERIEGIFTTGNALDLHPIWAIARRP